MHVGNVFNKINIFMYDVYFTELWVTPVLNYGLIPWDNFTVVQRALLTQKKCVRDINVMPPLLFQQSGILTLTVCIY